MSRRQRFVVELEAPPAWTTRDLKAKLPLLFQDVPFEVRQVERASLQDICDEAHALRDRLDSDNYPPLDGVAS